MYMVEMGYVVWEVLLDESPSLTKRTCEKISSSESGLGDISEDWFFRFRLSIDYQSIWFMRGWQPDATLQ